MAGHTQDDYHVNEQKPISFTVPFILAAVVLLITLLFLSLCDPKPHHAASHTMTGDHATSATVPEAGASDAAVSGPTEEPIAAPTGEHH
ncbi:MAG: hypothetical protein PSX36_01350 [bacterium]|nr:hypothetical protein [bacterium]